MIEYLPVGEEDELPPSKFHKAVAVSITINIIYLGSLYSPYMMLAFIHDPLRTSLFIFL